MEKKRGLSLVVSLFIVLIILVILVSAVVLVTYAFKQSRTNENANNLSNTTNNSNIELGQSESNEQNPEVCVENWSCTNWNICVGSQQTRVCADANDCDTTENKPSERQTCTIEASCLEDWTCASWTTCVNSIQTRSCNDLNGCGTTEDKPATSRTCTVESPPQEQNYPTTGDRFLFEKSTNRLNLGESLSSVTGSRIDDGDMPNILKDYQFLANNNENYDCEQNIDVGNLIFTNFSDNDYNDGEYTLGIKVQPPTVLLSYKIDFLDDVEWNFLQGGKLYLLAKPFTLEKVSEQNLEINLTDSGGNKLNFRNGVEARYNQDYIAGLKVTISSSSGKLDRIILSWEADDEMFITQESEAAFPVFNTLKLKFEGMNYPAGDTPYGNFTLIS